MATDPFLTLDEIFTTLGSQTELRSQMANSALSSALGFYQKKDYTRAASEFKRASALDPTNTQTLNYMANSYLADKKPDEAIKALKRSLVIDPGQDQVHLTLANTYLQQKKYTDAEKEYKAAIKANPMSTVAPYTLGQMYLQNNRLSEAEAQFKKVQRMAPTDGNVNYALGATYNKMGKYDEAVKQLTEAVRRKPKMAAAHFELGTAYAALGDSTKANKEVETLTKLDAAQGALLKATIAKPKMVSGGDGITDNFASSLGMSTQLYALDASLVTPSTSKEFRLTFTFDSEMDPASVQDPTKWTLTKASGGLAGYYNNTLAIPATEAYIPQNPTSVSYDPTQKQATVTFLLSQNATGDATLDPSHVVFKFSGKDIHGKTMDTSADQFDGFAQVPF